MQKDVREIHSPPPQPEDPDRAIDPGLEEDPDIFVELIDMTFYQLSCDGALVAIIADYPGLLRFYLHVIQGVGQDTQL